MSSQQLPSDARRDPARSASRSILSLFAALRWVWLSLLFVTAAFALGYGFEYAAVERHFFPIPEPQAIEEETGVLVPYEAVEQAGGVGAGDKLRPSQAPSGAARYLGFHVKDGQGRYKSVYCDFPSPDALKTFGQDIGERSPDKNKPKQSLSLENELNTCDWLYERFAALSNCPECGRNLSRAYGKSVAFKENGKGILLEMKVDGAVSLPYDVARGAYEELRFDMGSRALRWIALTLCMAILSAYAFHFHRFYAQPEDESKNEGGNVNRAKGKGKGKGEAPAAGSQEAARGQTGAQSPAPSQAARAQGGEAGEKDAKARADEAGKTGEAEKADENEATAKEATAKEDCKGQGQNGGNESGAKGESD